MGTSSTTVNGGFGTDADAEDAVAADRSPTTSSAGVRCWEPDPPAGMVSGGGGASLEAEEEALASKRRVKICRHKSCTRKNQGRAKLT